MAAACRERINEDGVRKAVNALLKWRKKKKLPASHFDHEIALEEEGDSDDFIYLSITLKKVPPLNDSAAPHRISLRHSLLSQDYSTLSLCLIVDGKKITSESAHKVLQSQGIAFIKVLKLSKLKSDYKSFESKRSLYDSFDVFFATTKVAPLLPGVLGKVFYRKKRKIPVPVELRSDGSNWKEEMERACNSSLWCLGSGTCSAVRVGRWGVTEGEAIVENVFEAIDRVIQIVPRKWGGIKCFHLKFSDSLALPIYEQNGDKIGGDASSLVNIKRKRSE